MFAILIGRPPSNQRSTQGKIIILFLPITLCEIFFSSELFSRLHKRRIYRVNVVIQFLNVVPLMKRRPRNYAANSRHRFYITRKRNY